MDIPESVSFPRLEALIRDKYRSELPLDTYRRYGASKWPKVLRFIGSRRELAEAFCADVRDMPEPPTE